MLYAAGMRALIVRFEEKYISRGPDDCWYWMASLNEHGYGMISVGGRSGRPELAHRVAYKLYVGRIPNGVYVLHECDNPKCVNPRHLYLGNQAVNLGDCKARGRTAFGERNGRAKLSDAEVVDIRQRAAVGPRGTQEALAREYGISPCHVSLLVRGLKRNHYLSRQGQSLR